MGRSQKHDWDEVHHLVHFTRGMAATLGMVGPLRHLEEIYAFRKEDSALNDEEVGRYVGGVRARAVEELEFVGEKLKAFYRLETEASI